MCRGMNQAQPGQPPELELDIARKNAVGLEYAARFPEAIDVLRAERDRAEQFVHTMHATSDLLNRNDIHHIYIKYRKLYQYYDSNADVVVPRGRWSDTVQLLEGEGYTPHVMFKEPDKIMFDKPGHVSVHLHPGVTWNGVSYFSTESLWDESLESTDGPWRELCRKHDFLVNLAHNIFENYVISLGDVLYFRRFMEAGPVDSAEAEQVAVENGWGFGFRRGYAQVLALVGAWADVDRSGMPPRWLIEFPYRIPLSMLAPTYGQRLVHQVARKEYHDAAREVYAYPTFYALKRRHDLPWLKR